MDNSNKPILNNIFFHNLKSSIFIFSLILLGISATHAQKKQRISYKPNLLVKIKAVSEEVTLYSHLNMQAWLYNKGSKPITIFRQDFTAPAWFGVIESWYCSAKQKTDTLKKLIVPPSSGFNENNIIELFPGDSLLADTSGYIFYEPGDYTFTYNILASRKKVKIFYAISAFSKKKAATITEFNLTSKPFNVICKPVIFSEKKIVELTLEEVNRTKKPYMTLSEAFKNPEEVFIICLGGQLNERDVKAMNQLRNIHSLRFKNITFEKENAGENTSIFNFPHLKELLIEESPIEIQDIFFSKLNKLETIHFKNVIYSNPSKVLNNFQNIKTLILTGCQINTFAADLSNFKNLVRLDLSKNNLKNIPGISNLPNLEYINIQENKLSNFPEMFNNPLLKSLCLSSNKIKTIPETIGKIKTLTDIDLSWNNISMIPSQIGELKLLTSLKLTGNQISHLPDKIKRLTLLKELLLNENDYSIVEPIIFKISSLEQLDLGRNNIMLLPDNFGKLSLLKQVDISKNKITQLPASLLRLKSLSLLKVAGNPISENKTSRGLRTKLKEGYLMD